MATYVLHNWAITATTQSCYASPEQLELCLVGYRDEQEKRVITSPIVFSDGRTVKTRSGSIYKLAEPDENYLEYLRQSGIEYDPEQPVKSRSHQ